MSQPNQRPVGSSGYRVTSAGFTLLENIIVVTIIAILAAIGLPNLFRILDQQKVNMTQHQVYQAIRATQQEATHKRQNQQFSIRERDGQLEWASHAATLEAVQVTLWQPLPAGVVLAQEDNTLLKKGNIYYVRFNPQGDVRSQLGRITLVGSGNRLSHRCVVVSTLIGAMRQGKGHARAKDERFCY
jgi:prepilin-type N-terminal cleavage/methylation domain-containing protein